MKTKIKHFLKEYWIFIVCFFLGVMVALVPLPYYVEGTGGLLPLSERFEIENEEVSSNYYMAYVSSYKGTLSNLIMAFFRKDYDIYKNTTISGNTKEVELRDHLLLEEASQDALIYAYSKAGKEVNITKEEIYVAYIDSSFQNNLKIGDKLLTIEGETITSLTQLQEMISNIEKEKVAFTVEYNGKTEQRYAYIQEIEGQKKLGIYPALKREIEVDPAITFHFDSNESGSSGGFMTTLAIYDALTNSNFSSQLKIAGTGTIDANGNVGEIGGIKYKILGAIKDKADIFFVPKENYQEAKETLEKESSNIKLIQIETFDEALEYLKKYE
jgi:PDZ domain-containing protein